MFILKNNCFIITKKRWNVEEDCKQNNRNYISQKTAPIGLFISIQFCMILHWTRECQVALHGKDDCDIAICIWKTGLQLFSLAKTDFPALVYFSSPWENILPLWQYSKSQLLQNANKTTISLPAGNHLSQSFTNIYFLISTFNSRWHIAKLSKFGKIYFETSKVHYSAGVSNTRPAGQMWPANNKKIKIYKEIFSHFAYFSKYIDF